MVASRGWGGYPFEPVLALSRARAREPTHPASVVASAEPGPTSRADRGGEGHAFALVPIQVTATVLASVGGAVARV
jgi:hypothetical protein